MEETNPLHEFVKALARRQARLDFEQENQKSLVGAEPNSNLKDRLERYRRQIDLFYGLVEDIEIRGEQVQSRSCINAPWIDCTVVTLAQRKVVKSPLREYGQ